MRSVLAASLLGLASAASTPWGNISRALVVFAHPDDAETVCGGMIATLVNYGVSVAYLVVTNGDKGWSKNYNMTSEKLAGIRRQEQLNAAAVLNVSEVWFLDQEDGRTEGLDPVELKLNITIAIRTWRPDVLLTFDSLSDLTSYRFDVVHRDHQTVGRVAMDAVYPAARDYLSFSELWPQYQTWDTPQVWLFSFQQVGGLLPELTLRCLPQLCVFCAGCGWLRYRAGHLGRFRTKGCCDARAPEPVRHSRRRTDVLHAARHRCLRSQQWGPFRPS
jgi:LmbE family N-acetylglucosaminyl deacetylase